MYQTNLFLDSKNAVNIHQLHRQFLILNVKKNPTILPFINTIPFASPAWWIRMGHFKLQFKST